jgi:hypothetical protein
MNSGGDYQVVWTAEFGYFMAGSKSGNNFTIDNPVGRVFSAIDSQSNSEIAINGTDVVRLNASGAMVGAVVHLFDHSIDSFAMDDSGNFVVVWKQTIPDPDFGQVDVIYAQCYSVDSFISGTPMTIGTQRRIGASANYAKAYPTVAMNSGGEFVVTWQEQNPYAGWEIWALRQWETGIHLSGPILVSPYNPGDREMPQAAINASGDFVVTWVNVGDLYGNGWEVFAQRLNSSGQLIGSVLQVNTHTLGLQYEQAVAMDSNGDFTVTWTDASDTLGDITDDFIRGRVFSATNNNFVGDDFTVNTYQYSGTESNSTVGMDDEGHILVAWMAGGNGTPTLYTDAIEGQSFVWNAT